MENGRIAERGSHGELMEKQGLYSNLIETFHSKQEDDDDEEEMMDEGSDVRLQRALSTMSTRSRAESVLGQVEMEAAPTDDGKGNKWCRSKDLSSGVVSSRVLVNIPVMILGPLIKALNHTCFLKNGKVLYSALPAKLLVDDTHAYILTDCKGGNP